MEVRKNGVIGSPHIRNRYPEGDIHSVQAFVEKERQMELEIYRKNPKAAQSKAMELYPDLGVAGSPLNTEFVARVNRYQVEKKDYFAEPDWPIRLAKECASDLAGQKAVK